MKKINSELITAQQKEVLEKYEKLFGKGTKKMSELRSKEAINTEYSDLVVKAGINRLNQKQLEFTEDQIVTRIAQLSQEMQEVEKADATAAPTEVKNG